MRLAAALPIRQLHPAVIAWAEASPPTQAWAVGFSGGADSLALLLLTWAHWPKRRRRMAALHFNHRLRGAAADRDEEFCREVSQGLGIKFRTARWEGAHRNASEAEARSARHAFFSEELRRLRTAALWLGHQQDDVLETMLMRLARGSGSGGLAAPRPVQLMAAGRVHLRPLLKLKKSEIVDVLRAERIPWREDATNASAKFLRNRMRGDVVPAWLDANVGRDGMSGAALSRELLEEDDAAMDAWLGEINPLKPNGALDLRRLAGRPRGLVRRALHLWLAANVNHAEISRQAFTALLDDVMVRRITRHSLGRDGFAKIGKTELTLQSVPRKLSN